MAPTEASILSNFLLPPAPLPVIISLRQFTDLFPRSQQSNPQIPVLYRELQHQRAIDIDDVKRNIAAEVKRGEKQQREVIRARRRTDTASMEGLDARDMLMEAELFSSSSKEPASKPHTLETITPEMEQACADLEAELAAMEAEAAALLADVQTTIGDLSDLRYGRFNKPAGTGDELGSEALESLKRLETVCNEHGNG
ncbi:hypothetical protein W97_03805 [Coniosporium apollinis CBS 100218]|uniref:Cnl2/NKP2 family protein n=1 Tax=Coniosporium apollinis (strain CBS 100218) TaxID=1168221 RepID=R7YRP4_CONA1|nr:uncharacterized protein W97_03805 [Coniosporium apollinis CBS 100218]EON64572.1 hypothetical protein W97_03805 [Coniosporium apollinis CBS 100218]